MMRQHPARRYRELAAGIALCRRTLIRANSPCRPGGGKGTGGGRARTGPMGCFGALQDMGFVTQNSGKNR